MAQLWHVVAMLHRSERCGTDMGITSFVNTKQIQHTRVKERLLTTSVRKSAGSQTRVTAK